MAIFNSYVSLPEGAMENHHFQWENPLQMFIFNSYVKLPEGIVM